jgi:hypothetical protein
MNTAELDADNRWPGRGAYVAPEIKDLGRFVSLSVSTGGSCDCECQCDCICQCICQCDD